jgi:hypothetical protein
VNARIPEPLSELAGLGLPDDLPETVLADAPGPELAAAERDPQKMSQLARGCLVPRVHALAEALRGTFTDHHGFLLRQILTQIDQLTALIATSIGMAKLTPM